MNKYILGLSVLAVGLASCSDEWDNHYKAVEQGEGSLWEVISAQSDLTNFAKLLKATDFDRSLNSAQVFTVFAPNNTAFTAQECDSLIEVYNQQVARGVKKDENTVVKEYVQNHIALYNYSVSADTNDSIRMMNYKYQVLGSKDLSGVQYENSNLLCRNGVLFKLENKLHYLPNIYECVKTEAGLDSVASFFNKYEYYYFSEEESVPGGIENGKTVYLDSVLYLSNYVLSFLNCPISAEDSSYTVLLPDNDVWKAEVEKHQSHFVYDKTVVGRDSLSYLYPRLQILDGTIYSRTNNQVNKRDDQMVSQFSQMYYTSCVRSLYKYPEGGFYYRWTKGDGVESVWNLFFNNESEQVPCSNGTIYKKSGTWNEFLADQWMDNAEINQEAEYVYSLDSVYTKVTRPLTRIRISSDNPYYSQVSEHEYVELNQIGSVPLKALFNVYNVLSNVDYDIYVVTVPPMAGDTLAEKLANNFRLTLMWNDLNGKQCQESYPELADDEEEDEVYFTSDPELVDVKYVCTKSFPTCSFGLDKAQVKILVEGDTDPYLVKKRTHTYTTRIDKFVFIPRKKD